MRDSDPIFELRKSGKAPAAIFIVVGSRPTAAIACYPGDPHPVVWTDGANPFLTDLRFVVGMRVHLNAMGADDPIGYASWFDALSDAGAAEIVGVDFAGEVSQWRQ